jgi:hypothetical protein
MVTNPPNERNKDTHMAKDTNTSKQTPPANVPPAEFDRAQTSFPPYWNPGDHAADPNSEDGWVHARFLGVDDSDPEFKRNVFQAMGPVQCQQGSSKHGTSTKVDVNPGELFTVSVYATFRVDRFTNEEMWFRCIGKKEANTPAGFVWDFDVRVPKGKAALTSGEAKAALPAAG